MGTNMTGFDVDRSEEVVVDGIRWSLYGHTRSTRTAMVDPGPQPDRRFTHTIVRATSRSQEVVEFEFADTEPSTTEYLVARVRAARASERR
jgi:hypothetical protein